MSGRVNSRFCLLGLGAVRTHGLGASKFGGVLGFLGFSKFRVFRV